MLASITNFDSLSDIDQVFFRYAGVVPIGTLASRAEILNSNTFSICSNVVINEGHCVLPTGVILKAVLNLQKRALFNCSSITVCASQLRSDLFSCMKIGSE